MGFFQFRKRKEIIDLRDEVPKKSSKSQTISEVYDNSSSPNEDSINFLSSMAGASSNDSSYTYRDTESESPENISKKQKLAKRLIEMTNKIEELSNQIYHLQQRVELTERKLKISQLD